MSEVAHLVSLQGILHQEDWAIMGGMVKDALLDGDDSQIEIRIRDGVEGPVILSVSMRSVRPGVRA